MDFPARDEVTLAGSSVYVLHDIAELDRDPVAAGFDLVIFGHSHRPSIETRDGVVFLNPGSAGPRRFRLPVTLATVTFTQRVITPEVLEIVPASHSATVARSAS